jgi:hypothetical protein
LFGLNGDSTDRAEGFFVVNATSSATVFTYEAKSTVTPSGSNLITPYTVLRSGGFYVLQIYQ